MNFASSDNVNQELHPKLVVNYVEPVVSPLVILLPQRATIYSGNLTDIEFTNSAGLTPSVRFSYIAEPDFPTSVAVTLNGADTALLAGFVITDEIENLSDTAQLVRFIVTPYIVDSYGDTRCTGDNDTSYIWVEPLLNIELLSNTSYNKPYAIFSNPNNGIFTIQLDKFPDNMVIVEIFGNNGQKLNSFSIENSTEEINLSTHRNNIFMVILKIDGKIYTERIIKIQDK